MMYFDCNSFSIVVRKENTDSHAGYICMAASEKFMAVWKTIQDSTITCDDMVLIQQHKEHVKHFLDALSIQHWQTTLENRLQGLNDVLTCKLHLRHLYTSLCESKIEGMSVLLVQILCTLSYIDVSV